MGFKTDRDVPWRAVITCHPAEQIQRCVERHSGKLRWADQREWQPTEAGRGTNGGQPPRTRAKWTRRNLCHISSSCREVAPGHVHSVFKRPVEPTNQCYFSLLFSDPLATSCETTCATNSDMACPTSDMSKTDITSQLLKQKKTDEERRKAGRGLSLNRPTLNMNQSKIPLREAPGDRASNGADSRLLDPRGASALPATGSADDTAAPPGNKDRSPKQEGCKPKAILGANNTRIKFIETGTGGWVLEQKEKVDTADSGAGLSFTPVAGGATGRVRSGQGDKDKPKKYFHITGHPGNVGKRIEYKHLDIPSGADGQLGAGSSGVVKRVFHRLTKTYFAMKILQTENADSKQLVRELELSVDKLRHKHCKYLVTSYEAFFRTKKLCILMELMEYGSLADVLKVVKRLDEPEAAVLSRHVLQVWFLAAPFA